MTFRGQYGLPIASEVQFDFRLKTYGPNYICYQGI